MSDPELLEDARAQSLNMFSMSFPIISKNPILVGRLTSPKKDALSESLNMIFAHLFRFSNQTVYYIEKIDSRLWSALVFSILQDEVNISNIILEINSKLVNYKEVKYEIYPYAKVFKKLYAVSAKPAIKILGEKAYVLPDNYLTAQIKSLVEMLGRGSAQVIRDYGRRIGAQIAQHLKKNLSEDDLSEDRYDLLYSLIEFLYYTNELPFCSAPKSTDGLIRINLEEDIEDKQFRDAVVYLNYGIIERLLEEFGFESYINRAERLELNVRIDGEEITIRVERPD